MKKTILLFTSIIFLFTANLHSQERVIRLQDCVRTALQNHPDILVSLEDKKQAVAKYKIVKSASSIMVAGNMKSVEYLKEDSDANSAFNVPGVDTDLGLFLGLTATYNLYNAKKSDAEKSARENIHLSKIKDIDTRESVILNVKKAYYEYIVSQENVRLWKKLLANAEKKNRQAQILFDNGLRPILDVTSAKVDLGETQLGYQKAQSEERLFRIQLFEAMGLQLNNKLQISDKDFRRDPQLCLTLTRLKKLAGINNSLIKAAKLSKKIKKHNIDLERAAHVPKVDFLFSLGYVNRSFFNSDSNSSYTDRFSGDNWSPQFNAGITAALPIYSGGAISSRVDSAVSEYNKTVYSERSVVLKINNMIQNHYRAIQELRKQFSISKLIIENTKKHLLLAQRSYENGEGTQLELQKAARGVIKAELGYYTVKKEYLLILASLAKIVGVNEEDICSK